MKATYEMEGETLFIHLPKEFDHHSGKTMKEDTEKIMEHYVVRNMVFDFSGTEFMDSSGIGIILGRYKRMRMTGGDIYIWGARSRIEKMLQVAGITQLATQLEQ